jgi:hypothetical protein
LKSTLRPRMASFDQLLSFYWLRPETALGVD